MLSSVLLVLQNEITLEDNDAEKLVQIDKLLNYLNEKKDEIRSRLPVGEYRARGGKKVNIRYIERHAIDIKKYFSYMLRSGKMKGFINSVKVTITNAQAEGLNNETIKKLEYVENRFKAVSIKKEE